MSFRYASPSSVEDALGELEDDALPMAGGVSLMLLVNAGLLEPTKLVSLARIGELRGVQALGGQVVVGAMTTHGELARHPIVLDAMPPAREAFGRIGNVRVR